MMIKVFVYGSLMRGLHNSYLLAGSRLLNPSAQDSQSGNRALRLTLAYADKLAIANPLANYLWFSSSPKVSLLTRMMDPVSYGMFKRKRGLFGLGGTDVLRIY